MPEKEDVPERRPPSAVLLALELGFPPPASLPPDMHSHHRIHEKSKPFPVGGDEARGDGCDEEDGGKGVKGDGGESVVGKEDAMVSEARRGKWTQGGLCEDARTCFFCCCKISGHTTYLVRREF